MTGGPGSDTFDFNNTTESAVGAQRDSITDFSKVDLLIIDGLYAINAPDIDLRVFIDLTYHETKINQIIRMKEALSDFRLAILEKEHQAVSSLKPLADLIVDKSYQVVTMEKHLKGN